MHRDSTAHTMRHCLVSSVSRVWRAHGAEARLSVQHVQATSSGTVSLGKLQTLLRTLSTSGEDRLCGDVLDHGTLMGKHARWTPRRGWSQGEKRLTSGSLPRGAAVQALLQRGQGELPPCPGGRDLHPGSQHGLCSVISQQFGGGGRWAQHSWLLPLKLGILSACTSQENQTGRRSAAA